MRFSRHDILVSIFLMASCLGVAAEPAAQPRAPVPDAMAQQAAKKAAGELFADRFKLAKTIAEKTALATDMMDAAGKVQAGSADQYVLLRIARDVAAGTGDAAVALQAAERLLEQFDEPAAELIGDTLLTAAREATTSAQHKAVAEAVLSLAGKLADADQYETALRLCEAARSSAQRARLYPLAKELTAQIEEIKRQQLLSEDYRKALSVLEDKPTDPEANLAAGRHLCFVKGNWDRGVPMLALGNDEALRAAAIRDLRGANSAEEQAAIGDAWWDLAEAKQGEERDTLRLRAGFWYRQAEPKLAGGLVGLKVKQRLEEVAKLGREIPAAPRDPAVPSESMGPSKPVRTRGTDPRLQFLADAVLLMTFEPDTITSKDGKVQVADLSGGGNDGTVEDTTPIPLGRAGGALQFGGTGSVLLPTLGNHLTSDLKQFSLALWVWQADTDGNAMIFDVGAWGGSGITLYRNNGGFRFMLPGGMARGDCIFPRCQPRTWYHLVCVWTGPEMGLYVNGQLAARVPGEGPALAADVVSRHPARIGTLASGHDRQLYFRGIIDEVAVFRRALSDQEIQILLQFGLRGEPLIKATGKRLGR